MEVAQADTSMKTEYALCYQRGKADERMVEQVRRVLRQAKPEMLLDSSYFVPWLLPVKYRFFTPVSYTEAPPPWRPPNSVRARSSFWSTAAPLPWCCPALFAENFECPG